MISTRRMQTFTGGRWRHTNTKEVSEIGIAVIVLILIIFCSNKKFKKRRKRSKRRS